jgi:HlyD family secretion protein
MRGKWVLLSGTIILAAVAVGALSLMRREPAQVATPVVTHSEPPAGEVSLQGTIQAQHVVPVGVAVAGEIESFELDVGQEVAEGQLLARIASRGLETMRELAARAVDNAQSKIDSMEGRILQARLEASRSRAEANRSRDQYERADKAAQRQRLLHGQGATPRLVYEKAQREFETAQNEFRGLDEIARQAEERVGTMTQEVQMAKTSLADKRRELDDAAASLAAAEVRSPVSGLMVGRRGQPGQSIGPEEASALVQIAVDLASLEVVLDPEPPVLARIRAGEPAVVFVADVQEGLSGTVKEIKGSQAIVEFVSPNPAVKPGMTAQVKIRLTP